MWICICCVPFPFVISWSTKAKDYGDIDFGAIYFFLFEPFSSFWIDHDKHFSHSNTFFFFKRKKNWLKSLLISMSFSTMNDVRTPVIRVFAAKLFDSWKWSGCRFFFLLCSITFQLNSEFSVAPKSMCHDQWTLALTYNRP